MFRVVALAILALVAAEDEHIAITLNRNQALFNTADSPDLKIFGEGFHDVRDLEFQPVLTKDLDYQIVDVTSTQITLRRKPGRRWWSEDWTTPGEIKLNEITIGDTRYGVPGIVVARALEDPVVNPSAVALRASTDTLVVSGSGFDTSSTALIFDGSNTSPIPAGTYTVDVVSANTLALRLEPGASWCVPALCPTGDSPVALAVRGVTTPHGTVMFPYAVTVALVYSYDATIPADDDSAAPTRAPSPRPAPTRAQGQRLPTRAPSPKPTAAPMPRPTGAPTLSAPAPPSGCDDAAGGAQNISRGCNHGPPGRVAETDGAVGGLITLLVCSIVMLVIACVVAGRVLWKKLRLRLSPAVEVYLPVNVELVSH